MKIKDWLNWAKSKIDKLDAELILAKGVFNKDRSFLVAEDEKILEQEELKIANKMLGLRFKKMPLAYILGVKEFYKEEFIVSKSVLIPRPETEALVDLSLKYAKKQIVEVGVGSGCVSITIGRLRPDLEVVGVEISKKALKVAKKNWQKFGSLKNIRLRQGNLLQGVEEIDVVVANLPYVAKNWDFISYECRFEPKKALYAKDNGLKLIKKLIKQFVEKKGRILILEADISQQKDIIDFSSKYCLILVEKVELGMVFENKSCKLEIESRIAEK